MSVTECNIEGIDPFVRFAGQIDFKEGDVTKMRCNADHRLFYIKKGKLTLFADDDLYELKTGDAVLLTSGVAYKMRFSDATSLIAINFVFMTVGNEVIPPKSLPMYEPKQFKWEYSAENPRFKCGFLNKNILVLNKIMEIGQLLERIIIEFKRMEPLYIKIIRQYLTACLLIIYRRFISGEIGLNGRHTDILALLKFVVGVH